MLRFTDTEGDPVLIHEYAILRVLKFRIKPGYEHVAKTFKVQPQSVIVDIGGNSLMIQESIDQVECRLKGYG